MAHFEERRYIVGGRPVLVLSGEVHYFRLARKDWLDRIRKTREAGCNALASYIPWLYHEEAEGDIDVSGRRRPEHDLGAFIDLCKSEGLWFIPRPGPFTMGEIKNEGIPDWVYTRCPDAIPTTWGGKKVGSKNLSYLDKGFLGYVEKWYRAVMPVIAERLDSKGGNVIAIQLDNEIGMIQCWSEEADLSDDVLCEFTEWVQRHHSAEELRKIYPFDIADPASRAKFLRDGTFPTARSFHADYREFNRDRHGRYIAELRRFAEESGVRGIPFVVNIHGSGGGRATTFPIGISQTYPSYTQAEGYWGSSDHYLGELTRQNAGDMYFLNAFMACVNRPEQPLSSIEFEAGTGDYGENGAVRQSGAATDFKARLSVVQGNRMLNHYLLAGGHNPPLERVQPNGSSRVGTTGGRHGFAAPINPEGRTDSNYNALRDTNLALSAVGEHLATMTEEHDDIAVGFIPDYYATDVKRPGPIMAMVSQVEAARGPLEGMVRSMLACGLSFPAVNLQAEIPAGTKAIALAAATCLSSEIQHRLLRFVEQGGKLLIYGRIPSEDLEGRPATALLDGLGVTLEPLRQGSSDYFPSLVGAGWASAEPEVRVWQVQPFKAKVAEPFLQVKQTDLSAAASIPYGRGTALVILAELPLHMSLWQGIFDRLGAKPAVRHDSAIGGVVLSRIRDPKGQRFINLINLDQEEKELRITEGVRDLFGRRVFLAGRRAKLLPLDVTVKGIRVVRSTVEISQAGPRGLEFRQSVVPEWVEVEGAINVDRPARVERHGNITTLELAPGRGSIWIKRL